MTTAADREVLRAWRDTHSNVRPAPGDARCVQAVWVDGVYAGDCGRPAQWIVDYSYRVRTLGRRPHCEAHTVNVISKWSAYERGEVSA